MKIIIIIIKAIRLVIFRIQFTVTNLYEAIDLINLIIKEDDGMNLIKWKLLIHFYILITNKYINEILIFQ
jgi:hypothetical protein